MSEHKAGDGRDPLRPERLEEFSGQDEVVSELKIVLGAAKERGELCDHLLFSGPPGLGKTTLANIVAAELGLSMHATSGPAIEKPGELAAILTGLKPRSLLFIDEIHRLPRVCEEILYMAMEDSRIDVVIGEGTKARTLSIPLEPFVLVGATTQMGLISAPLRDRFGYTPRLRLYDEEALAAIVERSAALLGVRIEHDGACELARRGRGTPRVANKWLRRVRDWAQVQRCEVLDAESCAKALSAFGVDGFGLDHLGREILNALCDRFAGGPVGVSTLAASVGETTGTLEEVYEPYLMHCGLLVRTPRGRMATIAAFEHLGLTPKGAVLASDTQPVLEFGS